MMKDKFFWFVLVFPLLFSCPKYERDFINYRISLRLNPSSHFHYLFSVYNEDSKEPNFNRSIKYFEAVKPKSEFQESLRL